MRIKGVNLDDSLIVELGRFTVLWNMFERVICYNYCNPKAILSEAPNLKIDLDKMKHLAKILNDRRELFNLSAAEYVECGLHSENGRKSPAEAMQYMEEFLNLDESHFNSGCLLAIYRIRNNMMHGLKLVEDLNNQLDLFRAVNDVLESIEDRRYEFL